MIHIKSEREIELLRESAQLVGRTLAEVGRHVRPGVKTAELDAIAEEYIRTRGAEPAFKGYRVGKLVFPASLCISVNDVVVHGIPGDYVLREGDLVSIDCGVLLNGYYGDSAYTFAVGEIGDDLVELCQATFASLHRGIAEAVAGRRIGDISHAVQDHCENRGFGVVRDLVGHGIGRSLHEDPQVPNFGRRGSGRKLREGMTLCIEPMINLGDADVSYDRDGWTVRAEDRLPSAHYEHMIVVRKGAAEILSTFEFIEEVIEAPYGDLSKREELSHG